MRIALVLASSTGGIGRHVASLARGLAGEGATVTVSGPAATEERFRFSAGGVSFVPVEIPATLHLRDARAVAALRRGLAGARPDIIHAHGLRAGLVAAAARREPVPLVVTWHNAVLARGLRGRAYGMAERYVARTADVNLGASADLVARATALGARDSRLAPVAAPPLGGPGRTRAAVRAELGVAAGTPLILSVGRLHPQKGYPDLVAVAARWRDLEPVPRVLIAGEGPSYLDLAAQISELHAPVTLLGHRTDVADLLAAADLAVVTSLWEARQLFTQEALHAGVPLIATEVGGIPELVGEAAELIPPSDPDALDTAIRRLIGDPQARADLAGKGKQQASTWPDEESSVVVLRELYAELTPGPD